MFHLWKLFLYISLSIREFSGPSPRQEWKKCPSPPTQFPVYGPDKYPLLLVNVSVLVFQYVLLFTIILFYKNQEIIEKNSVYILNVRVLYLLKKQCIYPKCQGFVPIGKKELQNKNKPLDYPQQLSIWYLCVFKIKNENNLPGPQTQGDHALLLLFHSFRVLSSRSLC